MSQQTSCSKMCSFITDYGFKSAKPSENILLKKLHHCLIIFFVGNIAASIHLDTQSTATKIYKFPNEGGNGPIMSIPHT